MYQAVLHYKTFVALAFAEASAEAGRTLMLLNFIEQSEGVLNDIIAQVNTLINTENITTTGKSLSLWPHGKTAKTFYCNIFYDLCNAVFLKVVLEKTNYPGET